MTSAAVIAGWVRDDRRKAILATLRTITDRPVTAVELAERAGIAGEHETQRRRVRELVAELREAGHRVCAGSGLEAECGMWLARDDAEWNAYLESRRNQLRFEFGDLRRAATAASERCNGQGTLFETKSVVF